MVFSFVGIGKYFIFVPSIYKSKQVFVQKLDNTIAAIRFLGNESVFPKTVPCNPVCEIMTPIIGLIFIIGTIEFNLSTGNKLLSRSDLIENVSNIPYIRDCPVIFQICFRNVHNFVEPTAGYPFIVARNSFNDCESAIGPRPYRSAIRAGLTTHRQACTVNDYIGKISYTEIKLVVFDIFFIYQEGCFVEPSNALSRTGDKLNIDISFTRTAYSEGKTELRILTF